MPAAASLMLLALRCGGGVLLDAAPAEQPPQHVGAACAPTGGAMATAPAEQEPAQDHEEAPAAAPLAVEAGAAAGVADAALGARESSAAPGGVMASRHCWSHAIWARR